MGIYPTMTCFAPACNLRNKNLEQIRRAARFWAMQRDPAPREAGLCSVIQRCTKLSDLEAPRAIRLGNQQSLIGAAGFVLQHRTTRAMSATSPATPPSRPWWTRTERATLTRHLQGAQSAEPGAPHLAVGIGTVRPCPASSNDRPAAGNELEFIRVGRPAGGWLPARGGGARGTGYRTAILEGLGMLAPLGVMAARLGKPHFAAP